MLTTLTPGMMNESVMSALVDQPFQVVARLFQNDIEPIPDTVLGDLVEADQDDYNQQSPLSSFEVDSNGKMFIRWNGINFEAPDSPIASPNTLYGIYLLSQFGPDEVLVAAARFATPLTLNLPDQEISVEVVWWPNTGTMEIYIIN